MRRRGGVGDAEGLRSFDQLRSVVRAELLASLRTDEVAEDLRTDLVRFDTPRGEDEVVGVPIGYQ
eukprot:8111835-Heterocapsa_arctica.AAC.1